MELNAVRSRKTLSNSSEIDGDEFARLYQSQLNRVFNYVRYRLGEADAEDIVAEVFTRVWSRRQEFDARRGTPEIWLWAIARNAVTDQLRKQDQLRKKNVPISEIDEASLQASDPLDFVSETEELDRIRSAMNRLASLDREIIALRFGGGQSHRAIGELLGLQEANVAQRLRRALRKLRLLVEGNAL
jgi:RNA polymerase sigma factor (sigma-70 family)